MKWLYKILNRYYNSDTECNRLQLVRDSHYDRDLKSKNINFSIYRADGGYVVETIRYEHKTDERHTNLYLINDEDDLGQKISHIITIDMLRR